MCRLVAEAARKGGEDICDRNYSTYSLAIADTQVIRDARQMTGEPADSTYVPTDPKEFCGRIFHTCYMGTENSSTETRTRAKELAQAIGR